MGFHKTLFTFIYKKPNIPKLQNRFLAIIPYLLPIIDTSSLIFSIFMSFNNIGWLWFISEFINKLYFSSSSMPIIIFFVLFSGLVRNNILPHVLHYHCMQFNGNRYSSNDYFLIT